MSSAPPPGGTRPPEPQPQPQPPRPPVPQPARPTAREARPVSFYLAIFLTLLLLISGALNLLLLFLSALGSAAGGLSGYVEEEAGYRMVTVGGDQQAEARVLRIPISGAIAEAASPLIGAGGGTVSQVRRALRAAASDASIKAVLLDIDSPGGGVTDSDEIYRLVKEFRTEHQRPVLALFGDMAASGGYYIAVAADSIMSRPTSITGSIGVIVNSFEVAGLMDKIGVEPVVVVSPSTPYKDMLSPFRPMKPEERAILVSIVEDMYQRFVQVVDEGRPNLSREEVQQLASGRVYSAPQALQAGLIDSIGSIDDAYAHLAKQLAVPAVQVIEQKRVPGLLDMLLGVGVRAAHGDRAAPSAEAALAEMLKGGLGPKLLYFWPGGR